MPPKNPKAKASKLIRPQVEGAVAVAEALSKQQLLQRLVKSLDPRSLVPQGQNRELLLHRLHGFHRRAVLMC